MSERRAIFGQGDEQDEYMYAEMPTLPSLGLPQHTDDDFDLERDSMLVSLAQMQKNLIQLEGIRDIGKGDYVFTLDDGPNRREYLHINDTFIKGAKRAVQARYESLATNSIDKQMALDTVYEVNELYGKR